MFFRKVTGMGWKITINDNNLFIIFLLLFFMVSLGLPEKLSAFIVMLSVHQAGTKIKGLVDQLNEIVLKEQDNPIVSRNFPIDRRYNHSPDVIRLTNFISCWTLAITSTSECYTIRNVLHNLVGGAETDLRRIYNYSKENFEYLKSLGRRLEVMS